MTSELAQRAHLRGLTPLQRHQHLLTLQARRPVRTEHDAIRDHHRFLWDADDGVPLSWEQRLSKKYHARLFKEYALADMSRYREGAVGLRWRTETEVFDGKGQFVCGAKGCNVDAELASFEVNFAYDEGGASKNALVKLRLCPGCAAKLNYRREQRRAADGEREHERECERRSERKHERKRKRKHRREGEAEDGRPKKSKEKKKKRRKRDSDDDGSSRSSGDEGGAADDDASNVWLARPEAERTQEEDMDDYLAGLFF